MRPLSRPTLDSSPSILLALAGVALLAACGDSGSGPGSDAGPDDVTTDTNGGDAGQDVTPDVEPGDVPAPDTDTDVVPDVVPDAIPDAIPDVPGDGGGDADDDGADAPPDAEPVACDDDDPRLGEVCGACDSGRFVCDEGEIRCEGDLEDLAFNACGGCAPLTEFPDDPCGACGRVQCVPDDPDATRCVESPLGCDGFLTCEDLSCDELGQVCDEDEAADAICGACLPGFRPQGALCVERVNCEDLACGAVNRSCDDADPDVDAACGACESGFVEVEGSCTEIPDCESLGCAAQDRLCLEVEDAFVCGPCRGGFREEGGACVAVVTCVDLDCASEARACTPSSGTTDAACGACLAGFREEGGACVAVVTCADLDCASEARACTPSSGTTDAACGACLAGFREEGGACVTVVTCADLDCDAAGRACVEASGTIDAACGDCLPPGVDVGGACVALPSVPGSVVASEDRASDVVVTWAAATGAEGYLVERCAAASACTADADWDVLTASPIPGTSFMDATSGAAPAPGAPGGLTATTDRLDRITLTWSPVVPQPGAAWRYAVRAVNGAGSTARSASDTGRRAAPAIDRYEVSVEGGAFTSVGTATTFDDGTAHEGACSAGDVRVSLRAFFDRVELEVDDAACAPAAPRSFVVRAQSDAGAGEGASTTGARAVGTTAIQWERSADEDDADYAALPGATTATFADTTGPAAGEQRFYRVRVSADNAVPFVSVGQPGERLDPFGQACTTSAECGGLVCRAGTCANPGLAPLRPDPAVGFLMGSPSDEVGRVAAREAQRRVFLTRGFAVLDTEVTEGMWRGVFGDAAGSLTACGASCPKVNVTWLSAVAYANALSEAEGLAPCYTLQGTCSGSAAAGTLTCNQPPTPTATTVYACEGYRLPTEAEWEFAYRAGTTTALYNGPLVHPNCDDPAVDPNANAIAWFCGNRSGSVAPVRGKLANAAGLHDMAGNAAEWVWDSYVENLGTADVTDPVNDPLPTRNNRISRGGSFLNPASTVRAAFRISVGPTVRNATIGFRVVRTLPAVD